MLFKLEESGFIICVCLILITSCIIMYYFHTRVSMIETSVSRQNQVLADFFSTVQHDLRSNTNMIGGDIHLGQSIYNNDNDDSGKKVASVSKTATELTSKKSKIEVSDDEDEGEDKVKVVKVLNSNSDSELDNSDSDSELDLDSDIGSDLEKDSDEEDNSTNSNEVKNVQEIKNDDNRRKITRNNEILVNAIEEFVEEKEKSGSNPKLNIKEIFITNGHGNNVGNDLTSSGISSLMLMINSSQSKEDCKDETNKTCVIEEVSDTHLNDNDNKETTCSSDDSDKANYPLNRNESLETGTSVKKMKLTKLINNNIINNNASGEKENTKKEGVAELRNKAILMGLTTREESVRLKKNELLELIKKNETTISTN